MLTTGALHTFTLPARPAAIPRAESGVARASASIPLCVFAVVALGFALQINFGQYAPAAMMPLALALGVGVAALALGGLTIPAKLVRATVACGLAATFALLLTRSPCATWPDTADLELQAFRLIVAGGAIAAFAALVSRGVAARVAGWLVIVAYVAAGLVVLRTVPQPGIDVCTFQRDAADALLAHRNPYTITFADPYGPARGFYGDDVIKDGRTTWGYPYLPTSLFVALPGHLLGDFRLSMLLAMAVAGALVFRAKPDSTLGAPAVALMLFTPRGFFVLEAGWIEPVVILGLSLVVFVASRQRTCCATREQAMRWRRAPGTVGASCDLSRTDRSHASFGWVSLAIAVGLFVATKQYLAVAVPLLWLLPAFRGRSTRWKALALAVFVAALVTLPLALWDTGAFVRSAVTLQFHQPFRPDALSFLVPMATAAGQPPPAWVPFAAALAVTALALWRTPRSASGFALSVGVVFFAFFAFNKQAFCNYYHFVIAALCCTAACLTPTNSGSSSPSA